MRLSEQESLAITDEVIELLNKGQTAPPFSTRFAGFSLEDGYVVAANSLKRRVAAGEKVAGRKIGFTNPAAWTGFGISAPFWSHMYDTTIRSLDEIDHRFPLAGLAETRLEPEIVVGLKSAPDASMTVDEVADCVDWVAHGFEIAQCMFKDWQFAASDVVAFHGLHGAMLIGPRQPATPDLVASLADLSTELMKNGEVVATGGATDVLGGPMKSLRELVQLLASNDAFPALQPGEIVTTGTLTAAQSIAPGETWSTRLIGTPLRGVSASFT